MGVFNVMRSINVLDTVGVQISMGIVVVQLVREDTLTLLKSILYQWEHRYRKVQFYQFDMYNLFYHLLYGYTVLFIVRELIKNKQ